MTLLKLLLCRAILLLEWFPAYRRFYEVDFPEGDESAFTMKRLHWRFMRPSHGMWGINLLKHLNLLWWYIDQCEERNG